MKDRCFVHTQTHERVFFQLPDILKTKPFSPVFPNFIRNFVFVRVNNNKRMAARVDLCVVRSVQMFQRVGGRFVSGGPQKHTRKAELIGRGTAWKKIIDSCVINCLHCVFGFCASHWMIPQVQAWSSMSRMVPPGDRKVFGRTLLLEISPCLASLSATVRAPGGRYVLITRLGHATEVTENKKVMKKKFII